MLMSGADYRDSLRALRPAVYVEGRKVDSVADEPLLAPGIAAIGVSYDYALRESSEALMRVRTPDFDGPVNRMLAIPRTSADLLNKLEAVRMLCQETGCAQRYLGGDALTALYHGTRVIDAETGSDYHARVLGYLDHVYAGDLTLGSPKLAVDAFTSIYRDRLDIPWGQPLYQLAMIKTADRTSDDPGARGGTA